jgi:hypothetical protein
VNTQTKEVDNSPAQTALSWLRCFGRLKAHDKKPFLFQAWSTHFAVWIGHEHGLSEVTILGQTRTECFPFSIFHEKKPTGHTMSRRGTLSKADCKDILSVKMHPNAEWQAQ